MDQFMERPGIAPAQGNGSAQRHEDARRDEQSRGLEDSSPGVGATPEMNDDAEELREIRERGSTTP